MCIWSALNVVLRECPAATNIRSTTPPDCAYRALKNTSRCSQSVACTRLRTARYHSTDTLYMIAVFSGDCVTRSDKSC